MVSMVLFFTIFWMNQNNSSNIFVFMFNIMLPSRMIFIHNISCFISLPRGFAILATAWKVSKYGPEKTPYLDTFHAV